MLKLQQKASQRVKRTLPHLYIYSSPWRWTLGFKTFRRPQKL